jgi:hypothetical protein
MSYQPINLGSTANDSTGDTLRASGDKTNDNFVEIYTLLGDGTDLSSGISATATVVTLTAPTISGVVGGTITSATITTLTGTTFSAGTLALSAGSITDSSGAINFGNENLTTTGSVTAASLDISGNVDIDGTLETDALTIDGVSLSETIADTVGAMVSSNTETNIAVTYDDADNTLDFVIGTLNQSTSGNAGTATALETARTIHGVSFDGTANIDLTEVVQDTVGAMFSNNTETNITATYQDADGTIDLVIGTLNQDTTGNAATATSLQTARTIGGVSFDGTANINLPGVNSAGNQNTTGSAATLTTARTIGGTLFDGSANIDVALATLATTVTITDNESTDENNAIIFTAGGDIDGGNLGLESDGTLTYNPSTGKVTATGFVGTLTGNVTGNTSGTAATVTGAAQTNITSVGTLTALQVDNINIDGNAITSTAGTDLTITPVAGQQIVLDGAIVIDAGVVTGATSITSTAFVGNITGDVTGNADTATTLATARTIGGVSFDGSANINLPGVNSAGNQNTSGSAATLTTARTIGGTSFDGSANIDVALATLATTATVSDSTANTNFPVVFHNESNALLDDTGALRYNPSTGTLLVPNLTVAGTTTTVDTVTMEAANAIIFEGATADAYETTLTITDPTADRTITLPDTTGTVALTSSNITGNAATATALATARTIGGVSFDGTANINLPGVNSAGNQNTTGSAATLTTARAIQVSGAVTGTANFDGSAAINIVTTNTADPTITLGGDLSGSVTLTNLGNATLTATVGTLNQNTTGTAATVTGAAQTNITSLGTLTALTVDSIIVDGTNIGHTSDTDAIAIAANGVVTFSQIPVLPANSIDSDSYVDGSIDTAHIADNQITLAKMAGIARGKIIYGDASGNPAVLTAGSNGQVLSSDGTDISWTDISVSSLAADNLTAGDAAILLTTSSGNITIDAAADDSDIILKGTDGGADTTYLTIDGSAAGAATFNSTVTATTFVGDVTGDVTGNADTATVLATARTIGGVSFNGSANINLPGVNSAGNQNTSGSAATLTTARTIGGTSFDGSANIDVALATLATTVTITDNESTNENNALIFTADGDINGGNLGLESDGTLTYNPSTGKVTATGFVGTLTGAVTGDVTGNADTATVLATARTIGGVSFNGSANIDLPGVNSAGNQNTSGSAATLTTARTIGGTSFDGSANIAVALATLATTATVSDSTANTNFPVVFNDESNALLDDTGALRYNPSTGTLLVPNLVVAGTTTQVDTVTMNAANAVVFEGATADDHETTLTIIDPTADRTQRLLNQSGYIPLLAAVTTTAITSTPEELNILDGATVVVGEINALDLGSTAVGTAIASKAVILDSNKDYTGIRNFTVSGELDAATGDFSGDVDVDGTLEADAITVNGTALNEFISDTVGAMVSSNTETGIAVTYQDADNTIDFALNAAQTTITSLLATDIKIGEDDQTKIDFETADTINFYAGNEKQLILTDGALTPGADNILDLGSSSVEFKDAYFDGTVTSDAFAGPLTGNVTGNADTATALATARTIGGVSFDGSANINLPGVNTAGNQNTTGSAATLTTARTIGGVSFNGSANIDLPGVNSAGNQNTSGSAATLTTARTIGGTSFDGSANIDVALATLATTVTVSDSTANTNFPVVFHDESNALLDDTGALRYNPSSGTLLVPNLVVAGTTTQVDTVTMNAQNAVVFEGATADDHETTLTIIDPTGDRTINLPNVSGTIPVLAAASTTQVTSTPEELNILDGATVVVGEINALDLGSTAVGTAIASKAVILDSNKDYTGVRNFTLSGELDAGSLDVSGDVDVDGTLEADAITVNGTALAEFISDTAGAMVSSNTETGITVTYQDADNTIDFAINAAQTTITSLLATDIKIGEDDQTKIDFETADEIHFYAANAHQIKLVDGALVPATDNDVDLGTSSAEFKDAYFDGTVTADAFSGPINGDLTGTLQTAAQANVTSLGTLTALTVDNIIINGTNIGHTSDTDSIAIASDGVVTFSQAPVFPDGSIAVADLDIDGATDIGAAIVDADLFIVDDGAGGTNRKTTAARLKTYINAGVSSAADDISAGDGAVNITTSSGNITIDAAANDSDIIFKGTDGGADITMLTLDGSAAGAATFNSTVTATTFVGAVTGNVTGNTSGTAATVTGAAQSNITSLGTLTTLTVDNIIINGTNIGHTSDTDSIAIASNGVVTFSQAPVFPDGSIAVADLDIDGATDIGAAIVDADLFIIDDGAGGTNRKTTAPDLKLISLQHQHQCSCLLRTLVVQQLQFV